MEIIVNAYIVHSLENIKSFPIRVNEKNFILVRIKLEQQRKKAIIILKNLFDRQMIKSIYVPKNKKIQKQLNQIVITKKLIKKSLEQIKSVFR